MTDIRVSDPAQQDDDERRFERTLRPQRMAGYIGQASVKENLGISIEAARKRGGCIDHLLFYGPPGLGKTTLAHIIANEFDAQLKVTSGPVLQRAGDLAAILTNLQEGDILFIDEIHRLAPPVEEILYPAMEDYQIDIIIGQGPAARSINLALPPFTLIGATTRAGLLTSPLRDRFGIIHRLDFYETADLVQIIERSAGPLQADLTPEGATEIARRSRGTPRVALRLLRRVRDYAEVRADGTISRDVAQNALAMMEVDSRGFDMMDRKMMMAVIETFGGGPVGVDSLATAIAEDRDTIEDLLEPYLIQEGLLQRTARGRIATPAAYTHFGLTAPHHTSGSLSLPFDEREL